MKRNIIENLLLKEISGVDRPAQPKARMTLMKRADSGGSAVDETAKNKEQTPMADAPTVEGLTKALDDTKAELAKAEVLAKMSDKAKSHMAKLSDSEKESFLSLSPEDQEKKVSNVTKNDETLDLAGQTIRKSEVGDSVFAVMKAQADQLAKAEERITKAEDEAATERLAKRADDEMAHLPGNRLFKARVLKAADTLSDEDKAAFTALVKAANDAVKGAFEEKGTAKAQEVAKNAEEAIETAAKEIAKRDNVSIHKAREMVGAERPELYEAVN